MKPALYSHHYCSSYILITLHKKATAKAQAVLELHLLGKNHRDGGNPTTFCSVNMHVNFVDRNYPL
jgi:hypothetical protein